MNYVTTKHICEMVRVFSNLTKVSNSNPKNVTVLYDRVLLFLWSILVRIEISLNVV